MDEWVDGWVACCSSSCCFFPVQVQGLEGKPKKKKPTKTKFEYGNISQPASIGFLGGVAVSGINQTDRRQGLNAVY
jgi:hypothetical protein